MPLEERLDLAKAPNMQCRGNWSLVGFFPFHCRPLLEVKSWSTLLQNWECLSF